MTYDATTSATFNALAVGQTASDSFTYTTRDAQGATSTAAVPLTANARNDGPTARDNAYTTDEDTSATGNIRTDNTGAGTDSDPDSGETAAWTGRGVNGVEANVGEAIMRASGATLTVLANGSMTYDPTTSATFNTSEVRQTPTDSFTYTIHDTPPATSSTLSLHAALPIYDGPTARDNAYTTDEDTSATGNIRTDNTGAGTDSDPDSGET